MLIYLLFNFSDATGARYVCIYVYIVSLTDESYIRYIYIYYIINLKNIYNFDQFTKIIGIQKLNGVFVVTGYEVCYFKSSKGYIT